MSPREPTLRYATTMGELRWSKYASAPVEADDPVAPDGKGWRLVGSALGELRNSRQPILWFWENAA